MPVQHFTHEDLARLAREAVEDKDKLKATEDLFLNLLNQRPDDWHLLFWLAGLWSHAGKWGVSNSLLQRCLQITEEWQDGENKHQAAAYDAVMAQILNNIGANYRRGHMNKEAEKYLLQACQHQPDDADHFVNLSTLYVNEGHPEKGQPYADKAVALHPGHAWAHWNRSLLLLEQGRWAEGFSDYVWGLVTRDRLIKHYIDKRGRRAGWWRGDKVGTLVVYGEQGVGDEVMFASLIPDLQLFCDKLIVDCHPRLETLFRRSFPDVVLEPTRKTFKEVPEWASKHEIDAKCSIATAAKWLRYDEKLFPKVPYLELNWDLANKIIEEHNLYACRKVVGISWVGGVHSTRKDLRAIHLQEWLPVFKANPDVTWVSLQYTSDHAEHDLKWLKEEHGIDVLRLPEYTETTYKESYGVFRDGELMRTFKDKYAAKDYAKDNDWEWRHNKGPAFDLDRMLALMAACDAIVTVNNSTVHFAGAAGLPCLTLTPQACAWRYGQNRTDMPFYSITSVVQYRQTADGWPMEQLAYDLQEALCTGPKLPRAANS